MIIKIWMIIFLIICSITDLYERKVYTTFCIANGIVIGIMQFFIKEESVKSIVLGLSIGIILIIYGWISKGVIGIGDGIVICVMGLAVGFVETLEVILWSLIVCIFVAVIGMTMHKLELKSKVPLIPFLLLGTIITNAIKGV